MKFLQIAAISVAMCLGALAAETKQAQSAPSQIVWAGLDYSLVRMIGPDFRDPQAIFPGMLDAWNSLFLRERIDRLGKKLKAEILVDVAGVAEVNKKATEKQIEQWSGAEAAIEQSHITEKDIEKTVKSYKLQNKSGTGLVFIVDRLVKEKKSRGAVYVVFFDVATRKVISSERQIHPAAGAGFRNYWFRVIKGADEKIKMP